MAAIHHLEAAKNRISLVSSTVGFNVMAEDFKFNLLSYISIFDCITYMIINGYDIKLFWGELLRVCFCLVTWSFGYQCSVRIVVFSSKEKTIKYLYNQVYKFVLKMEKQMATNVIVRKFVRYIDIQSKGIFVLFYLSGLLTIFYPLIVYIFVKEAILPFGFVIPGLSDSSQPGYAINYCHHVLQVILTVGGLTAAQCMNIMLLVGACLMIEVLIIKIRDLGKEVYANEDTRNMKDVDMSEIIELHQEILKYLIFLKITDIYKFS